MTDDYRVTAEFYDLLQATEFLALAQRLLDRWLGTPSVGVLDVGAGTGIATALLAKRCTVPVHAIEPSASMRAVMLSRLAGRVDLLGRVRVHARPVQRLGLSRAADFAICLNMMAGLDTSDRADALAALGAALVPRATLVVQAPPVAPTPVHQALPDRCLGGDTYGGDVTCTPVDGDRVEWRFAYRVSRAGAIIREETERFDGFAVPRHAFVEQLADADFTVVGTDEPDVLIAHRTRVFTDGP